MNLATEYISLHVHTIKSINDSTLKIDKYIEKAKELKLKSLCITNHGVLSDVFEFYSKCKEANIKPIIGCEVYVVNDRLYKNSKDENNKYHHLVLIAKNKNGFKNLLKIHNDAQINGFYSKPRTDINVLKKYGKDIIALSACIGGEIPDYILKAIKAEDKEEENKLKDKIKTTINNYKEVFDEFYLELQPGDFPEQIIVNQALIDLSKEENLKTIITNDVHYLNKEDYKAHNIHVISGKRKTIVENPKLVYPDTCYYVMSTDDLVNKMSQYIPEQQIEESFKSIKHITDIIEDYDIIPDKIRMPKFDCPEGYNEETYLEKLCFDKLDKIKLKINDPSEYTERLMYELDTISELGFCGYFLVVWDFIKYARENNIPVGPGRGSVCSSLVAFLLEITKVDPLKYNLLFERFLSKHRPSPPDIDTDFDAKLRYKMFEYVKTKYGYENCALVSTFAERKAKCAIKDSGRALGKSKEEFESIASLIPTVYYEDDEDGNTEKLTDLSIEDTLKISEEFSEIYKNNKQWIDTAINLENIPKATSIHAAGTLISPIKLSDYIPLIRSKDENLLATALNLKDAESAGFIKFDFLSLCTLGTIDKTLKLIGKQNTDFIDDNYNDPNVWNLIGSNKTTGLFQISSNTYKQRMKRLAPKTIKELAACLALVRGPCIASKADKKYMNILEGKEDIELIHPVYDEVTKDTCGILIYQEQLMKICFNMGFSLDEGYKIMKLSAKKKIKELKEYEKKFMKLAENINMDKDIAEKIFKMIVDTGLYSFNESHGIAYAILCYITAYLKYYYPIEFLTASLTNAYERKEPVEELIKECRRLGIGFKRADINKSSWEFSIEDNKIRIGLCAIKSMGLSAANEIISKRPFTSLSDFLNRIVKKECTKRSIIPAILLNCFGDFYEDVYSAYEDYFVLTNTPFESKINVQGESKKLNDYDSEDIFEKAFLGANIINSKLNELYPIGINHFKINSSFQINGVCDKIKKYVDKNGNDMAFIDLNTGDGTLNCTIFSNNYSVFKSMLSKKKINKYNLKKTKRNNDYNYIINSVEVS